VYLENLENVMKVLINFQRDLFKNNIITYTKAFTCVWSVKDQFYRRPC